MLKAEQDLAYEMALQRDLDKKHAEEATRREEERLAREKADEEERQRLEAERKVQVCASRNSYVC